MNPKYTSSVIFHSICISILFGCLNAAGPVVMTKNGPVMGNQVTLPSGMLVDQFFGIPFAEPPVGDFRLEFPRPLTTLRSGVLDVSNQSATTACLQVVPLYNQSEDCLHLDIFVSDDVVKNAVNRTVPVLVYIHGGGFVLGSTSSEAGPALGPIVGFSQNFVSRGILVVRIQYRLAINGFFSDGSDELPGNLGLWDQTEALRWIQNNIGAFGGDRNKITLWGESAGGGSVSLLTASRHSRDLFHQAIQFSGSLFSSWVYNQYVVNYSLQAATALNCTMTDSYLLKQCLKAVSVQDLKFVLLTIPFAIPDFAFMPYNPRYDNSFFDAPLEYLIAEAEPKSSLIFFNADDGLTWTGFNIFGVNTTWSLKGNYAAYSASNLTDFINTNVYLDSPGVNVTDLRNQLIAYYVNGPNVTSYFQQYTHLLSDIVFMVAAVWEVGIKSINSWPVYMSDFAYVNTQQEASFNLSFYGVPHACEISYLINDQSTCSMHFNWTADDYTMKDVMVNSFANFVKTGDPSYNATLWPLITPNEPFEYVQLQPNPMVMTAPTPVTDRVAFWVQLATKFNLNSIHGFPRVPQAPYQ